jgi:hypothetical protein
MKRSLFVILMIVALALSTAASVASAAAESGNPPATGICPDGFTLHMIEDGDHHEHHIGLKTDLNGNGYLCVKILSEERHVHIDDVIP